MQGLDAAVDSLATALKAPPRTSPFWRHVVRHHLDALTEALVQERSLTSDAWLSPRTFTLERERSQLLARLDALSLSVLDSAAVETLRHDLLRLVQDVSHHRQRVHDLYYDAVSLDVGGSE